MAWDPSLMQRWGAAMGAEQKLKGTNVMLGPDVNLARVPWSGRVFETNGEDPFLSAKLVGPQIRGIQSNNISACVKHFIFNNHEYVLRVFPLCALVPRVQRSSGAVATVQFVWRGRA